jgi:phosphatidylserine/phosphatidylglycerophosphate/cardiolipin synthase-like enzyme
MPITVSAYAGVDDAFVVWNTPFIDELRGFALRRRVRRAAGSPPSAEVLGPATTDGTVEEMVSSWVGFANGPDFPPGTRKPTNEWPIQKYFWTDYAVAAGDTVAYRVVPVFRDAAGALHEDLGQASGWTAPVTLGPVCDTIDCYFNRGIVASQWLARLLPDDSSGKIKSLTKIITTPGDRTREFLRGPQGAEITKLLKDTASSGGHIYAALYELDDPELEPLLKAFGKRAHVVLGNGSVKKKGADQNSAARAALAGTCDIHDRFSSPRALAHNKFLVICDAQKQPQSVWTGSMNWTRTGMCTQANNSLHVRDTSLAGLYLAQWKRLANAGDETPDTLRTANGTMKSSATLGGTSLWFTPMADQHDLEFANERIMAAKQGILFLMFNPGPMGTLLNSIVERTSPAGAAYDPDLYIQGVLNQDPSTETNKVALFHRGAREDVNSDVLIPSAIERRLKFWVPELLKLPKAFAMVHSKVIVIDPFGANPVVMTGSHNLGPKASGTNDENFLIIEGNKRLAAAYASNIMGIYAQYRWRSKQSADPTAIMGWKGLADDANWQIDTRAQPLKPWDNRRARELKFWMGQG